MSCRCPIQPDYCVDEPVTEIDCWECPTCRISMTAVDLGIVLRHKDRLIERLHATRSTELLAALEGERRTHAAASRAGLTRQEPPMREPTIDATNGGANARPKLGDAMRAEHAQTEAHAAELRRRAEQEAHATGPIDAGVYSASFTITPGHPEPRFPAMTLLDQELATLEEFHVPASLNHLRDLAYSSAVAAGWHDPKLIEGIHREPSAGERVALIHEEATELLGHIRDGYVAGHWTDREGDALPSGPGKPEGPDVELADIVIRCLDYAGRYEIDIGAVIAEKMRYNRERAHRQENERP